MPQGSATGRVLRLLGFFRSMDLKKKGQWIAKSNTSAGRLPTVHSRRVKGAAENRITRTGDENG
jgi:hypothetical protein